MFKAKECVHIPQSISLHQEFYDPREFERFPMDHAYSQANYQGPGIGSQNPHRWEELSPYSIDGSSNMKKNSAGHIENLQKTPSSIQICVNI